MTRVLPGAVGLVLSTCAGLGVAALAAGLPASTFAAIGFCLVTIAGITWRYVRTRNLLDPLIMVSAAMLWYFGIHVFWLDGLIANPLDIHRAFQPAIPRALAWLTGAYVVLFAAHEYFDPRPKRMWRSRTDITTSAVLAVYAVGVAGGIHGISIGAWSRVAAEGSGGVLTAKAIFSLAAFAFTVSAVRHYQGKQERWVMPALGLGLVAFSFVGSKTVLLEVAVGWLVVRHYIGGRRLSPRAGLAAIAIFMFVLTPVIQSSRSAARAVGAQTGNAEANAAFLTLPKRVVEIVRDPSLMLDGFQIINLRTQGTESVALSMRYTQRYELGHTWLSSPFVLVPAKLYPGKPDAFGVPKEFSIRYAGQQENGYSGLAISPTIPGDLWVNFGGAGLLLGFALFGVALRFLSNVPSTIDPYVGMPIFVLAVTQAILLEVNVAAALADLLLSGLTIVVGTVVLRAASNLGGARRTNTTRPVRPTLKTRGPRSV